MKTTTIINGQVCTSTTAFPSRPTLLNEANVRRVLEAMGKKRVRRGMQAFTDLHRSRCDSTRCFLARGVSTFWEWLFCPHFDVLVQRWARRLNVDERDIRATVFAFDAEGTFPSYVTDWLNS